jgi:hypothetical protein
MIIVSRNSHIYKCSDLSSWMVYFFILSDFSTVGQKHIFVHISVQKGLSELGVLVAFFSHLGTVVVFTYDIDIAILYIIITTSHSKLSSPFSWYMFMKYPEINYLNIGLKSVFKIIKVFCM